MKPVKLEAGRTLSEMSADKAQKVKDRIVGREKSLPVAAFNSSI